MRLLLWTAVFAPSVGGIERLTALLAAELVALGHEVRLATSFPGPESGWTFPVVRQPTARRLRDLLRWCDVHLQANVSLRRLWMFLGGKPVVVTHQNEYADARSSPWDVRAAAKGWLARRVEGVACSRYVAGKVGCATVIGNPYDDRLFRRTVPPAERDRDLVFLGRLVSVKGCRTLLEALLELRARGLRPTFSIIGDGEERAATEAFVARNGLAEQGRLLGTLHGEALARALNRHRIIVVPSAYAEPFGMVALEGLACGCVPVVSSEGGLIEATGGHGLSFRNGDSGELAARLSELLTGPAALPRLLHGSEEHLRRHTIRNVALRYARVLEGAVRAKR